MENTQVTLATLANASLASLVAFYNAANPEATVKRFASRQVAEKRVGAILEAEATKVDLFATKSEEPESEVKPEVIEVGANHAAFLFPKATDFIAAITPENSVFGFGNGLVVAPVAKEPEATQYELLEIRVDAFLNGDVSQSRESLEAEVIEAYSEGYLNEVEYTDLIRKLAVPDEGDEETEEEEAARIAAEANAESSGPATKAKAKKAGTGRTNSEGVAASWLDKEVRAARLIRDGVAVTYGGSRSEYRSTAEAFRSLRLDFSRHIKFRLGLKASRKEVYSFEGVDYLFEIIGG
jgi:hypothetical protein